MALVNSIVADDREFKNIHPTTVECRYLTSERDGRKVIQFNTYGSLHREMPDKLSQTIQFDEGSARKLWQILSQEFGFKG